MATDWIDEARQREIRRLGERVDRIEGERRDEKDRAVRRWTGAMFAILWLEIGAVSTLAIVRAAGSL